MYCYTVRLACLNHAASVQAEPGSNSSINISWHGLILMPGVTPGLTVSDAMFVLETSLSIADRFDSADIRNSRQANVADCEGPLIRRFSSPSRRSTWWLKHYVGLTQENDQRSLAWCNHEKCLRLRRLGSPQPAASYQPVHGVRGSKTHPRGIPTIHFSKIRQGNVSPRPTHARNSRCQRDLSAVSSNASFDGVANLTGSFRVVKASFSSRQLLV